MTLTKADIANVISSQVGYTRKHSLKVVDSLFELIKHSLENGEDVLISGFGKFSVKEKRERRTNKTITTHTQTNKHLSETCKL